VGALIRACEATAKQVYKHLIYQIKIKIKYWAWLTSKQKAYLRYSLMSSSSNVRGMASYFLASHTTDQSQTDIFVILLLHAEW